MVNQLIDIDLGGPSTSWSTTHYIVGIQLIHCGTLTWVLARCGTMYLKSNYVTTSGEHGRGTMQSKPIYVISSLDSQKMHRGVIN